MANRNQPAAALAEAEGAVIVPVPCLLSSNPIRVVDAVFFLRSRLEYEAIPEDRCREMLPYALRACEAASRISAIEYAKALDDLEHAKAEVTALFEGIDYMITPALAVTGFAADSTRVNPDSTLDYLNFMALFNQTSHPAAVVNCGMSPEGLPIGLQIAGHRFDDLGVLQVTKTFEDLLDASRGLAFNR